MLQVLLLQTPTASTPKYALRLEGLTIAARLQRAMVSRGSLDLFFRS